MSELARHEARNYGPFCPGARKGSCQGGRADARDLSICWKRRAASATDKGRERAAGSLICGRGRGGGAELTNCSAPSPPSPSTTNGNPQRGFPTLEANDHARHTKAAPIRWTYKLERNNVKRTSENAETRRVTDEGTRERVAIPFAIRLLLFGFSSESGTKPRRPGENKLTVSVRRSLARRCRMTVDEVRIPWPL